MMLRDRFSPQVAALLSTDEWLVAEEGYDDSQTLVYETLFALANGRMGNRASHEEGDTRRTLPANYIHGVFDRSEAFMRELCNTPDWTKLKIYLAGDPIGPGSGRTEAYLRVLDMRGGLVAKRYVCETSGGRRTLVETVKLLSRAHPRVGLIRLYVTPLNYGGLLEFENIIDATVANFMDMPRFRVRHLKTVDIGDLRGMGCYVESATRDNGLPVGTAAMLRMYRGGASVEAPSRRFRAFGEVACEFVDASLAQGETLCLDKYAAVATGRETGGVMALCRRELEALDCRGFEQELAMHKAALAAMWERADVKIEGDAEMEHAVRFNIFHLMSTPDPLDSRVNIGAKLLHGEEYGGHAFWDTELFVLPFFNYAFPDIARNLVQYRYHLLGKALENARANGYGGAQYPWESADTGEEECPAWTIEYDGSCYRCYVADYEHHVTAAVAYGLDQYVRITDDSLLMREMGLELLLQTAQFWASRMEWNPEAERYEIRRVTGPDEWHEPVNNNTYTNHLARWNLLRAVELFRAHEREHPAQARALGDRLRLSETELEQWRHQADRLFLQADKGLIEQFDGYFAIPDAVIGRWDEKGMPVMPESCKGKRGMERKVLKQADVVMLMFLLPGAFDMQTQRENFDYYEKRTMHRSSLSPCIHCMMGLRVGDDQRAYAYLERSAYVDLRNNQGNAREGIHAASAGGTWQCVTLGYCGMSVTPDGLLAFSPRLPQRWTQVDFHIQWRGDLLHVQADHRSVRVLSQGGPIRYLVNGEPCVSQTRR